METVRNEIMTAQEVARYLRLAEATVYRLAQEGEIPAAKLGRAWRFKKELIDDWFRHQANAQKSLTTD
jgi:PTS system nitrogen regulatory IIA component